MCDALLLQFVWFAFSDELVVELGRSPALASGTKEAVDSTWFQRQHAFK